MLNNVQIQGNLTEQAIVKMSASGVQYCNITIACNQGYGEKQKTDFIKCVAYGMTAQFIERNFEKGSQILVEGLLHNNNFIDKNSIKHYSYEVVISNVNFCGYKNTSSVNISTDTTDVINF